MFKVGDIVVHKDYCEERYTILEIHPERERYAVMIEPFPDVIDVVKTYFIGFDTLYKQWNYDESYYRKLKLQKICSKLET